MDLLTHSETVPPCPFKGDATYFSLGDQVDMAWSYEHPLENVESIMERLAFDGKKIEAMANE